MVGVNIGAGLGARARTIAWVSALTGAGFVGSIGCIVAAYPPLWLNLFSHQPDVLREGAIYLRFVAPAYTALGFGFVLAFAAQGAGHVLWPFVASVARILLAAGGGMLVVGYFGGGMTSLAAMVTASLIAYAAVCSIVMLSRTIWRLGP
jgi:Na+-driven multidrug efflux pump